MPEYPDIVVYIERLESLLVGSPLEQMRFTSPFLLRTAEPPIEAINGRMVHGFKRLGKRIVFVFDEAYFLVLHLMIAGRLHWKAPACKIPGKVGLAALDFPNGSLLITEAGSIKRASLHLVVGNDQLAGFDPGGLEIFDASPDAFYEVLVSENHCATARFASRRCRPTRPPSPRESTGTCGSAQRRCVPTIRAIFPRNSPEPGEGRNVRG